MGGVSSSENASSRTPLIKRNSSVSSSPHSPHLQNYRSRIVDRKGRFRQSLGQLNIKRVGGDWRKIYYDDPFHTLINTPTSRIIGWVFFMYSLVIVLFAFAYLSVGKACNIGVSSLTQSYFFSLETIMTIGYSAPKDDIFFGNCVSVAMLISLESFAGIFLDSICIGIFFARFSRANTRANTVIFSDFAVVRRIRGHFYLMFRTCERRKHQLVEAHVRLYAIRHDETSHGDEVAYFQTYQMRVQQPDDDAGACLLMALPQTIVHRIDQWSPLFPPECLPDDYEASVFPKYPDPMQRACDVENGSREYHPNTMRPIPPTQAQIKRHIKSSELEIVVILEGIDGPTSNTMQARHSYTARSDVVWNSAFELCVSKTETGGALIDFDKFHMVKPAPLDSEDLVPQSIY